MDPIYLQSIEKIANSLDKRDYLLPEYRFSKRQGKIVLLGMGSTSLVYELCAGDDSEKKYALKIRVYDREERFKRIEEFYKRYREVSRKQDYFVHIRKMIRYKRGKRSPDSDEGVVYAVLIVMEKLSSLVEIDRGKRQLLLLRKELSSKQEVYKLAVDIGNALRAIHDAGMLHRDIKLENIFWDERKSKYKLGDFGSSRVNDGDGASTVIYTDGYGAPEIRCRIGEKYDERADIYSYGMVLYLLLNNLRFPSSDGYYVNSVQYMSDYALPAPSQSSDKAAEMIYRMCCFNPKDRYGSMEEILQDLKRYSFQFVWNSSLNQQEQKDDEDRDLKEFDDIETEKLKETESGTDDKATETFIGTEFGAYDKETETFKGTEFGTDDKATETFKGTESGTDDKKEKRRKKYSEGHAELGRNDSLRLVFSILFSCLSVLIFNCLSMYYKEVISSWTYVVPGLFLFLPAVLQKNRKACLAVIAGLVAVQIALSIWTGTILPQAFIILCLITGVAGIQASGTAGFIIWMIIESSGISKKLDFLNGWGIGLIVLAFVLATGYKLFALSLKSGDGNVIWGNVFDRMKKEKLKKH